MIDVRALGYVVVEATRVDAWRSYAQDVLGMQALDAPDGALYLKMDERDFRYVIVPGTTDRYFASGWEVPDGAAFDTALATLQQACVEAVRATRERVREGSAARVLRVRRHLAQQDAHRQPAAVRRRRAAVPDARLVFAVLPGRGRRAAVERRAQGVRDDDRRRRDAPGAASREPR